ncbi:MAG TPA: hypothetical protein VLN59_09090, partial [Burkholderiales bacterium]|nr:hypothetical protein [Burkholderiales bacterium]
MPWDGQPMMRAAEWIVHRLPQRRCVSQAQKGQILLMMLLLLGMVGAAVVYGFSPTSTSVREQDRRTSAALAQARDALIGRAAADDARPGSLPCPDADNDGDADGPIGYAGNNCQSYVGRLPWRTLGLPDLRDSAGERLWYVLSSNFRDYQYAGPLNPDAAGQLVVKNDSGATIDASAVAIIIAPGPSVGTQVRDAANQLVATMYLDGENANGDATYVTGPSSAAFNDRLVYISREALFASVTVRVAKEVNAALENYRAANNYYPAASPYTAGPPNYDCVSGRYQGYVPLNAKSSPVQDGCRKDWETGTEHGVLKQPQLPP